MKVILEKKDIEKLFKDTSCIILSDWEGTPATLNKTDDGKYYMVRWEEYDPCTDMLDIDTLIYNTSLIAPLFQNSPSNCLFPDYWKEFLEDIKE